MRPIATTAHETVWFVTLDPRGGPLVGAARRFLAEHPGAPEHPFPPGAEGLRRLASAIDAWAERADDSDGADDEGFVEGAGALLGCVLLDHFAGATHAAREGAHRVRLGAHGFFDPFRAVESALEGPDARTVLVEELTRAEHEAASRAGVGRAIAMLRTRLAALRPDVAVRDHFEHLVELDDGVELDLARVLVATEGESDASLARALDKLVSMLPGGSIAHASTWDEARVALLPRLVSEELVAEIQADPARGRLALRRVAGGALSVALILGYEDRARYLRDEELARFGVDAGAALVVALENLASRSASARFARVDTSAGPLVVARTGDGLDGARLLLPALHEVLAPELGSPFLAAAPHRDALFACAIEPPELRAALERRVHDDHARAPHRITPELFVVSPRGLARAPRAER